MVFRCHVNSMLRVLCVVTLFVGISQISLASTSAKKIFVQAPEENNAIEDQPTNLESPIEKKGGDENGESDQMAIPTSDELVEAKISALKHKQEQQEMALAEAEQKLAKEIELEKRTFDEAAYLTLSIRNDAPKDEYKLLTTEIFIDGKRFARGGKRNAGLPRVAGAPGNEEIFFGAVEPGCHDIEIKARYQRQRRAFLNLFKVSKIEQVDRSLAFNAKNGHHVEIAIVGFEAQNSFFNWARKPEMRFDRLVRPNFLPGTPILSMEEVLNQGRARIEYITEDQSGHRLIQKHVSIDGLPILVNEKHDEDKEKALVFDAPLAEGKHRLNVVLLFGEKRWVAGGPLYNFRLSFDRDFYVMRGHTTTIALTGMPTNGFRSSPENTRYARATSRITLEENRETFSDLSCREQLEKARITEQKKIKKAAIPNTQKPTPTPDQNKESLTVPLDEKADESPAETSTPLQPVGE